MALVRVPENRTGEFFQQFYDTSAFTFEGVVIDKTQIKNLEKLLRENGYKEKDFLAYWFTGKDMNKEFGLTDTNAYSDDLTFLVIPKYYNVMVKLASGARWFDDIVCNNSIRQNAINGGIMPDYGGLEYLEEDDEE